MTTAITAAETWWRNRMHGEPGSAQRFAHELQLAFNSTSLLRVNAASAPERKEIRRKYRTALSTVKEAFSSGDTSFFRRLADGLEELERSDHERDPACHMYWAYAYCCRNGTHVPTRGEVIEMTKRQWALVRLTGCVTALPQITYDAEFEAEIAREIKYLPEQKWARHFKALGMELAMSKPGPKRQAR